MIARPTVLNAYMTAASGLRPRSRRARRYLLRKWTVSSTTMPNVMLATSEVPALFAHLSWHTEPVHISYMAPDDLVREAQEFYHLFGRAALTEAGRVLLGGRGHKQMRNADRHDSGRPLIPG